MPKSRNSLLATENFLYISPSRKADGVVVFGLPPLSGSEEPLRGEGPAFFVLSWRVEPMTVYEWLFDLCKQRGMLEAEAATVLERMISDPSTVEMRDRWGESIELYTEPLKALLVHRLSLCVVRWIEQENPRAFYKPLFDGTVKG
jgi:hypothetical protein